VIGVPDNQDRLLTYGDLSFAYQDAGELQSRTNTATGEMTLYAYDPLGNLRQVTLPGGTIIDYEVDGRGRRVGKRVNGALVKAWLYTDTLRPAAELDGSGAVLARFVYGERVNVPEVMVKGGIIYRMVTDHLGSVRLVVDATTEAIVQWIDYDEFGRVLLDTSPGFQPFGFAGGLHDPDTGLVRFGARDYDPEVGRWTAKDPLLFDGGDTNLYAYALNDPVNRVDPNGRYAHLLVLVSAEIFGTALVVTGVVGLCMAMASLLEDELVDGFPPVPAENNNGMCPHIGDYIKVYPGGVRWRICQYDCPDDCPEGVRPVVYPDLNEQCAPAIRL
jgi:RHS repeat-associated protein